MNRTVKGIVLRQSAYKEKDAMITLLSNEGIISFSARGILSPTSKNAASCLLYNYSEFLLSYKGEACSLSQGKSIKTFSKIYSNLEAISIVSLMAEATLRFADEDNVELFDYFINILYSIENGFDSSTLLAIYLAKVISQSGYELSYSECVNCGSKSNIVKIDYKEGGYVCSKCATSFKEEGEEYLKSFRYCFMISSDQLEHYRLKKENSIRLINEFSTYLCECFEIKALNSLDLYNKSQNM